MFLSAAGPRASASPDSVRVKVRGRRGLAKLGQRGAKAVASGGEDKAKKANPANLRSSQDRLDPSLAQDWWLLQ